MIELLMLQLKILQLQLQVLLLRQKLTIPNLAKPQKIIIHHESGWLTFNGVDIWHRQKWGFKSSLGFYCGYQYFIERNGTFKQARRDNEEGAHTVSSQYPAHYLNRTSIGICLMGNGVEKDFTPEQYRALKELVDKKTQEYGIPKKEVYGHRDFSLTVCPSDVLYKWVLDYKT